MTTTDDRSTRLTERLADMQADAPPVIPPCPSWCVSKAALHPLDFELEDGVCTRTHEAFTGSIVTVGATERSDGHGGPVTLSAPDLLVCGEDYKGEAVASGEVMSLATELHEALRVRDRLTSVSCPSCAPGAPALGLSARAGAVPQELPVPWTLDGGDLQLLDQGQAPCLHAYVAVTRMRQAVPA